MSQTGRSSRPYLFLLLFLLLFAVLATAIAKGLSSERVSDTIANVIADLRTNAEVDYSLLLGSSTMRQFDTHSLSFCGQWLNRGVGTALISDLTRYLRLPAKPKRVRRIVLYAGDNDIARAELSVASTMQQYEALQQRLLQQFSEAQIYLVSIKPSPRRVAYHEEFSKFNSWLKTLGDTNDRLTAVMPEWGSLEKTLTTGLFTEDGVHLSAAGRAALAEALLVRMGCQQSED